MADVITCDVSAFRALCPEFANTAQYPDAAIEGYWAVAAISISPTDYGALNGAARRMALNLLAAHMMLLADKTAQGVVFGLISQAGVDKETVSITPPPVKSGWDYWLSTTPRGLQLLSILQSVSRGGFYVGGSTAASHFHNRGGWR